MGQKKKNKDGGIFHLRFYTRQLPKYSFLKEFGQWSL